MAILSGIDYIIIVIGLLSMIPGVLLFNWYKKTKIFDFGLFSLFWLLVSLNQFFRVYRNIQKPNPSLLSHKLAHISMMLFYFILFVHAVKIKWERSPPILWNIGVIWISIMIFSVLFYEIYNPGSRATVLFLELYRSNAGGVDIDGPTAVFMTRGGIIIMAHGYLYLFYLFRIAISILLLYTYSNIDIPIKDSKIVKIKNVWIIAWVAQAIHPTLQFIRGILNIQFPGIFTAIGDLLILVLVVYNILRYPQSLLISKIQIINANRLYQQFNNSSLSYVNDKMLTSISEYLSMLPDEIVSELNSKR